jgi:hypothetical protein
MFEIFNIKIDNSKEILRVFQILPGGITIHHSNNLFKMGPGASADPFIREALPVLMGNKRIGCRIRFFQPAFSLHLARLKASNPIFTLFH